LSRYKVRFGTQGQTLVHHYTDTPNSSMSLNNASPTITSPSPCSWIACPTRSAERNEAETTAHLEAHWKETRRQWLGPRGCNWPDCPSRATFKSPSSLKSHIFNIHISPLVCTYPQCTYPNPFGKECDLRRHIETVHEASCSHMCPVESCEANVKGFARKDKLLNHVREQHDNLRCPYNHCYATVLEADQDAHLQQFHGSFECALGACEKEPASCFLEVGLRRHVRSHHNLTVDPAGRLIREVREIEDKTARSIHIVRLRKWKDCPACSEAQSALGLVQNNEDLQTRSEDWTSQGWIQSYGNLLRIFAVIFSVLSFPWHERVATRMHCFDLISLLFSHSCLFLCLSMRVLCCSMIRAIMLWNKTESKIIYISLAYDSNFPTKPELIHKTRAKLRSITMCFGSAIPPVMLYSCFLQQIHISKIHGDGERKKRFLAGLTKGKWVCRTSRRPAATFWLCTSVLKQAKHIEDQGDFELRGLVSK